MALIADFVHIWVDPLHGDGYQWWSGFGAAFTPNPYWIAAFAVLIKHHNCHVKGCWNLGHRDPEHGFPACRKHHSRGDQIGKE